MFRDASEELARLEAELLAEEGPEEELLPEEEESWEYEDDQPEVFQNYSNHYGSNLRNYANGYNAYNTDRTDEDLEAYSEEVRKGSGKKIGCLAVILCLLTVALAAAMVVWMAYERGLL